MYARTATATIEITAILAMGLMRRDVMGSCGGVRWLPMLYVHSSALVFVESLIAMSFMADDVLGVG